MKQQLKNCLSTTALSLLLLSLVAICYHAQFLCIETVFQVLLANILIHGGLLLLQRFESQYALVEITLELGYILVLLIGFGYFFNWYSSTPLWVLLLLGLAVYIIGGAIDLFCLNQNLMSINQTLKHCKETTQTLSKEE